MARRDRLQEELGRVAALREGPPAERRRGLEAALASKSSVVVARAAKLAAESGLSELAPPMAAAFERLLGGGAAADRGCQAKTALVTALRDLGVVADGLYARAARWLQPEASFGPPVDTAAELRAAAAVALVETRADEALTIAAELLADPEPRARIGAIRALVASGSDAAALLLRFKALTGDREAEVMSECLGALLDLSPAALAFVTSFLDREADVAALAALAIGQSHLEGAFEALTAAFEARLEADFRKAAVVAIGLLREERCFEFLLEAVRGQSAAVAAEALVAAQPFARDELVRARLEAAVRENRALDSASRRRS